MRARRVRRAITVVVVGVSGAVLLPPASSPVTAVPGVPLQMASSVVASAVMAYAGAEDGRGEAAAAQVGAVVESEATGVGDGEVAVPAAPSGANPTTADVAGSPLPERSDAEVTEVVPLEPEPPTAEVAEVQPGAEEVVDKRTQTTRTYANPDGTFTMEASLVPVHAGEDGEWVPVDPDLAEGVDDSLVNGPAAVDLELAEKASADRLVTIGLTDSRSVSYALEGAAEVEAEVEGAVARYRGVFPGVDLELESTPAGLKEDLILASPEAPSEFRFPLDLENLTAEVVSGQGVVLRQRWTSLVEAVIPPGFMVDSGPDGGARSEGVAYRLEEAGGETTLVVTADRSWLDDPARVWPVTIDPTLETGQTGRTWLMEGMPGNHSADPSLLIGRIYGLKTASYVKFNAGWLANSYITAATLNVWNHWSFGGCTAHPVGVHQVTQQWNASTMQTYPGATYRSTALHTVTTARGSSGCPATWVPFNVRNAVHEWMQGISVDAGFTLRVPASHINLDAAAKQFNATDVRLLIDYRPDGASYQLGTNWIGPSMRANRDGKFPVNVRNRGTTTWPAGNAYRLGYRIFAPGTNTLLSFGALRTPMPEAVSPQELVNLEANVGRLDPGTYDLEFDMVREGVHWFKDIGVIPSGRLRITVVNEWPAISAASPLSGEVSTTLTPQLSVTADDPDDHPSADLQYLFRVCRGSEQPAEFPAMGAGCQQSSWQSSSTWTPILPTWERAYTWWAQVREPVTLRTVSFQSASLLALNPPQPDSSRWGIGGPTANDGGVDLFTRNFVSSVTDADVGSGGPPLAITRTYNSQARDRVGAFGAGWSSILDVEAEAEPGGYTILITTADGRQQRWGLTSESGGVNVQVYRGPMGVSGTLTRDLATGIINWVAGDGWRYKFLSHGGLELVTDTSGRSLWLSRTTSNKVSSINAMWPGVPFSTATRNLLITWDGDRVASVKTDQVSSSSGRLTWTYSYSSHQLTEVCDPRPAATQGCVTYTYAPSVNGLLIAAADDAGTYLQLGYETIGLPEVVQRVDGESHFWSYSTMSINCPGESSGTNCTRTTVTQPHDAADHTAGTPSPQPLVFEFDEHDRLVKRVDEYGNDARWEYDGLGFLSRVWDENDLPMAYWYDTEGRLLAQAAPRNAGTIESTWPTTRYRYDGGFVPGDPRYGKPSHVLDPRALHINHLTAATRYTYDALGRVLTITTPSTPTNPAGRTSSVAYDPVTGLLATSTDEAGRVTTYTHDPANGDLVQVTSPTGVVTEMAYDGVGRPIAVSEHAPSDPIPGVTTFAYDAVGNVVRAEGPEVANVVTGAEQAHLVTREYDRSRRLVRESIGVAPASGTGEPVDARTTTWSGYDGNGRPTIRVEAVGTDVERTETTTWTWRGQPRTVDSAMGARTRTRYTLTGRVHQTVAEDLRNPGTQTLLASTAYDPAGRVASEVDAVGAIIDHTYWDDGLLRKSYVRNYSSSGPPTPGGMRVLEDREYDAAGNLSVSRTRNGTLVTTYDYTTANDLQEVNASGRRQVIGYRPDGQVASRITTDDDEYTLTEYVYSPLPEAALVTVRQSTGTTYLDTTTERDEWGRVTATIDPGGRRIDTEYDRLGRPVRAVSPPTVVEGFGEAPATERPTTEVGYDVFGAVTESRTPDGEVTSFTHDALGRPEVITFPSVERPDGGGGSSPATVTPTETYIYDDATRMVSVDSSPAGGTATEVVDYLGRVVTRTDPLGGVASFAWNAAGDPTATTDALGALRTYVHDTVGNLTAETVVERHGTPGSYTTSYAYDDRFDVVQVSSPEGGTVVSDYNQFGEVISTTTPSAGMGDITSAITRDFLGRAVATTDGLGRRAESSFDMAGRRVAERNYQGSTLLRQVSYGYTPSGEVSSVTAPGPNHGDGPVTTNYQYDGHGQVTGVTQPGGIATSYGYDVMGRLIRSTDGNGNATWFTHNAWGDLETVTDPATAAHPDIEDRRWVASYEAPGLRSRTEAPGGVAMTATYDAAGQVLTESGTGGDDGPVGRSFDWDLGGRLEEVTEGGATTAFTWDDRGNVLSASGAAGSSTFAWDGDGRMTSRTDAAGSSQFTYWPGGQLQAMADGLTGASSEHYYDIAGQPLWTNYSDGSIRYQVWDGLGNPAYEQTTGATTYSTQTWTWGPDGAHLASTTRGPGPHAGAGTETYTYDAAGRLVASQGPAGTVATTWDAAGNRLTHGGQAASFDERNRLLSTTDASGVTSFSWSERGTLEERTPSSGPATGYDFDAFDRLVEEATGSSSTAYAWDGLDRLIEVGGQAQQFAGMERDPVAATGELYGRGADGEIRGFQEPGGVPRLVRGNHRGDLTTSHEPGTTDVSSRSYTPFGETTEVGVAQPGPGFQGDWTSASGIVHMDARWYDPTTGTFLSRDTANLGVGTAAYTNRYTYAAANPLTMTDPTGHLPKCILSWRGCAKEVGEAIEGAAEKVKDFAERVRENQGESGHSGEYVVTVDPRPGGRFRPEPPPIPMRSGKIGSMAAFAVSGSSWSPAPIRRAPGGGTSGGSSYGGSGGTRPSRPMTGHPSPSVPAWWASPTPTHRPPPGHAVPPSTGNRPDPMQLAAPSRVVTTGAAGGGSGAPVAYVPLASPSAPSGTAPAQAAPAGEKGWCDEREGGGGFVNAIGGAFRSGACALGGFAVSLPSLPGTPGGDHLRWLETKMYAGHEPDALCDTLGDFGCNAVRNPSGIPGMLVRGVVQSVRDVLRCQFAWAVMAWSRSASSLADGAEACVRATIDVALWATGAKIVQLGRAARISTRTTSRASGAVDDAFTHGYRYHPRIRARGLQDPVAHNFPYSYDDVILRSTPVRQADGSLLYRIPGSINGKDGFFEIALNPDTGTIFHRTFVGG